MSNKLEEKATSLGTYSIPSAAIYIMATINGSSMLHLTTRHLYRWTEDGLAGGYLKGIRNRHLFINFKDLISLRAIAVMRANGMRHHEIIIAEQVLKERYQCDYPFATVEFWTAPPSDVFIKEGRSLLSASKYLQSAMDFFEEYLQPAHRMAFDLFGQSATWRPHDSVLFDPQVKYGEPCIEGTGVPTQVIWSFYKAGDSIDSLSYFYEIQRSRLKDAIAWENHIQEVAHIKKL